jgi:hypothetical protein
MATKPKAPAKPKKAQIPLKEMLSALDRGDKDFYNRLDDELKKAFSPWLAMRYASSCNGMYAEHYLLMVNDLVNHEFTALNKHPELQWKLMALCGAGSNQFHTYLKPPKKKGKNPVQSELSKLFPNLKADELELLDSIHTQDEIKQIFSDAGYSDKEIKDIFK